MNEDQPEKFIEEETHIVNNQLDDGEDSSIVPSITPEPPSIEKDFPVLNIFKPIEDL